MSVYGCKPEAACEDVWKNRCSGTYDQSASTIFVK